MTPRQTIQTYCAQLLAVDDFKDYCPNGLQVEGADEVKKILTAVTASQAAIDRAIEENADALFVHHGYFWKGESESIVGMKQRRIKALLKNNINLFAFHLPLDAHPVLGNNAQLAKQLALDVESIEVVDLVNIGQLKKPMSVNDLEQCIKKGLNRTPQVILAGDHLIHSLAWCTGGAQSYVDLAQQKGADAYISGEISEPTVHAARENGIHYFAAGHHATERYGVKALGEHLADKFDVEAVFFDEDNPV